jgi:hypothetical protein
MGVNEKCAAAGADKLIVAVMRGTSIASATLSCLLAPPSAGPSHKPIDNRTLGSVR